MAFTRRFLTATAIGLFLASRAPVIAQASGGKLEITVIDRHTGQPIPCRMHLTNGAGRPRKVEKLPFWHDHFVLPGTATLKLPVGSYEFEIERGLEYVTRSGHFRIENFADDKTTVDLKRFTDLSAQGWWSGDLDVARPAKDMELLMKADDLHVAQLVTWENGKTLTDVRLPSQPQVWFDRDRWYHVSAGRLSRPTTQLLLLNLPSPLNLSEFGPEYPPTTSLLRAARENPDLWVDVTRPYWWDLPVLVAHGQVDSIELAHGQLCRTSLATSEAGGKPRDRSRWPDPWGNAQWSQHIYFQLLECGLRIPPSAGSGSGVSPNPVGYNRVYVHVDGEFTCENWWKGFRAGRLFITNGPLLVTTVAGERPGHVFQADQGAKLQFEIGLTLSTRDPISYLELIKNGQVEHSIRFQEYASSGKLPKLDFDRSGWFVIRAVTDKPKTYRFAMTAPYYVEIGYERRISRRAAQFFLEWVYERARQIQLDDPGQQREVLEDHRKARDFWQDLVTRANAP